MTQDTFANVDLYITALLAAETPAMIAAKARIQAAGMPDISVSPNQGKLLQLLMRLCRAERVLELGTLGGYSTLWLAGALPPGGTITTIEANPAHAAVARRNLAAAGEAARVDLREGRALDVLHQLAAENAAPFDFVFIDADKPPYATYFELALQRCRQGAVIIADNVIRKGQVLDENSLDGQVAGVRKFNRVLSECRAVDATILQTIGVKGHDGMAIAVVR